MSYQRRNGSVPPFVRALIAAALVAAGAAILLQNPAGAATPPLSCPSADCATVMVGSAGPEGLPVVSVRELSDIQRRSRLRRCCARYYQGLPLKGYLCSPAYVQEAFRRGICTRR